MPVEDGAALVHVPFGMAVASVGLVKCERRRGRSSHFHRSQSSGLSPEYISYTPSVEDLTARHSQESQDLHLSSHSLASHNDAIVAIHCAVQSQISHHCEASVVNSELSMASCSCSARDTCVITHQHLSRIDDKHHLLGLQLVHMGLMLQQRITCVVFTGWSSCGATMA